MAVLYSNNAEAVLSATITDTTTSLSVNAGQGSLFPATASGWYPLTLISANGQDIEIVRVMTRTSDTFTVIRGQEGTTAKAFAAGAKVELRLTKALLDQLKWDAVSERYSSAWDGNLILSANNNSTRTMGMASGSNTTLVLQGGAPSGPGANLELTSDLYAYLDANQTSLRSHDGSTVFLTAKANVVDIPNGNLSVGAFLNQVNWGSAYRSMDVSSSGGFAASSTTVYMANNSYNNGNGWMAKTPNPGVMYAQTQTAHTWYSMASVQAGTQQTLATLMTLSNAGALNVVGALTQNGSQVLHAGNWNSFAQATLVSGTNIKTVNGISLLGSGDITVAGSGATSFYLGTTSVAFGRASGTLALAGITLDAASLTSGTVAAARLGSGTANSSSFLRGDGTWQAVTASVPNASASVVGAVFGYTGTASYSSVLLGNSSNYGSSNYNTAIGSGAYAYNSAVAVGTSANANGNSAVAVGYNAQALNSYTTAIGQGTNAGGQYATVFGYGATTNAQYAVSLGPNANAGGYRSLAAGYAAYVESSADSAVALGTSAYASGAHSVAIGPSAGTVTSTSERAIAIGYGTKAAGQYHISIGSGTTTENANTSPVVAIGPNINLAHNSGATVIIKTSTVSANYTEAGFFVDAVTEGTADKILYYDTTKKKIMFGAVPVSSGSGGSTEPVTTTAKIVPVGVSQYGPTTLYVSFETAEMSSYVQSAMANAGMAASSGYSTATVDFILAGTAYTVNGLGGNTSSYINPQGPGFTISNLTYSTYPSTLPNGVYIRFQQNIMAITVKSQTSIQFQTNGGLSDFSSSFTTHKPFAFWVHPGDGFPIYGSIGPSGLSGTPTVTNVDFNGNNNTITGTDFGDLPSLGGGSYSKLAVFQLGLTTVTAGSTGGGGGTTTPTLEATAENVYWSSNYGMFTAGPSVANSKSLFFIYPMGYAGSISSQNGWQGSMSFYPGMFMSTEIQPAGNASFYVSNPGLNLLAVKTHTVGSPGPQNQFFSFGTSVGGGSTTIVCPPKSDFSMFSGGASQYGAVYIAFVYSQGHPNAAAYDTLTVVSELASTTYTKSGQIDIGGPIMKYKLYAFPVSSLPSGGPITLLNMTSAPSMMDQIGVYVTYSY